MDVENHNPDNNQESDIAALFKGFSDAIMEKVDQRLSEVSKPATESNQTQPSTLTQRIAQLEKQLAEKAESEARLARQQSYDNSLKNGLSKYNLAFPQQTTDILKGLFASQVDEVEGKWLSKDGKSLDEHLTAFFETDFGQHLLKAPSGQHGTGTQPVSAPRQVNSADTKSAVAKLFGLA